LWSRYWRLSPASSITVVSGEYTDSGFAELRLRGWLRVVVVPGPDAWLRAIAAQLRRMKLTDCSILKTAKRYVSPGVAIDTPGKIRPEEATVRM
jgi:hypothetical protein